MSEIGNTSSFGTGRRRVQPGDVEQRAEQVLDGDQAAFDAFDEALLLGRHVLAVFVQQGGEQLGGVQRLQQVVRRGGQEPGLRRVGVLGFGLGLLQCGHGLLQFRGAVRHALLEQGLGLDEFAFDDLGVGDVRVGRYVAAAGHGLAADLDDLAVDEVALILVRRAGTKVLDTLLDLVHRRRWCRSGPVRRCSGSGRRSIHPTCTMPGG